MCRQHLIEKNEPPVRMSACQAENVAAWPPSAVLMSRMPMPLIQSWYVPRHLSEGSSAGAAWGRSAQVATPGQHSTWSSGFALPSSGSADVLPSQVQSLRRASEATNARMFKGPSHSRFGLLSGVISDTFLTSMVALHEKPGFVGHTV